MTYAPEIQSVEIPPDQLSEGSDNLQEYFDKVAAEGGLTQASFYHLQNYRVTECKTRREKAENGEPHQQFS